MKHYPQFEVLRGFAAVWVLLSHLLLVSGLEVPILSSGGEAVELFVILSGFVIALLCMQKQESYGVYIFRRFMRLYPLFLIALLLGMATSHLYAPVLGHNPFGTDDNVESFLMRAHNEHAYFWQHLFAHLTMLHGAVPETWLPQTAYTFSGPLWSISLEWQFYLIAPFLVAALDWRKHHVIAVGLLFCSIVLLRMITYRYWPEAHAPAFLPLRLEHFTLGIFCALVWERARQTHWQWLLLAGIAILLLYAGVLHAGIFPMMVWLSVYGIAALGDRHNISRVANRLLRIAPARWVGTRSYGVYVLHMPIVLAVSHFFVLPHYLWLGQYGVLIANGLLIIPIVLILAAIGYHYIEAPSIAWARKVGEAHQKTGERYQNV